MILGHRNARRGFTLIELLVVIAIIGILSAVVLASLDTARNKGADAAVKSNLATIQTQAELYYDANGGYGVGGTTAVATGTAATVGTACNSTGMFGDPTIQAALKSSSASAGIPASGAFGGTTPVQACGSGASFWSAATVLKTNPAQAWCVDQSGRGEVITVPSTAFAGCP